MMSATKGYGITLGGGGGGSGRREERGSRHAHLGNDDDGRLEREQKVCSGSTKHGWLWGKISRVDEANWQRIGDQRDRG